LQKTKARRKKVGRGKARGARIGAKKLRRRDTVAPARKPTPRVIQKSPTRSKSDRLMSLYA
jgi:hypothetical protein